MRNSYLFTFAFLLVILSSNFSFPQQFKVIESTTNYIILEVDFSNSYNLVDTVVDGRTYQKINGRDDYFRNPGEPWLPSFVVNIGIPFESQPKVNLLNRNESLKKNQFIIPYPVDDPTFKEYKIELIDQNVYSSNSFFPKIPAEFGDAITFRFAKIVPLKISPFQFNPVTRDLIVITNLKIRIDYNPKSTAGFSPHSDIMTNEFLSSSIINYDVAKNFIGKLNLSDSPSAQDPYWYDPLKNYFKIYIKTKGVYRITYEELISAGVPLGSSTSISKLELYSDGQRTPIHILDNNTDSIFNAGDYFQFVGLPPSKSPYCTMNIFNLSNVYWFSYQSDSTGLHYVKTAGNLSNYTKTYYSNLTTIHFEKDSLFERLGLAQNGNRDYWFWDKVAAVGGQSTNKFAGRFNEFPDRNPDSSYVHLKVGLHGITDNQFYQLDHKAYISITNQPIGEFIWAGQRDIIFEKSFYVSSDSINIFPMGNLLQVEVRGDLNPAPADNDEIRVNWYEFDYWRLNRIHDEYYNFKSFDYAGRNRFWMWQWEADDMRIYVPSKNKMILYDVTTDNVSFVDTMRGETEYFCASFDYYQLVDSIIADSPSTLRSLDNGADYIIVTHPDFNSIAEGLANLRENNFPDESIQNPRIKVVDILQIYDEFSYGLLDPYALKDFVQYAFEEWQSPAPTYVVIVGDMSYDYRALLESSRPNFVPSIPFWASQYGQAASDNLIVAVAGNDLSPDLAIGRLSMETIEQGNILLNKLINYPDDPSKEWNEDILLVASGLSLEDEIQFGFNDASVALCETYVSPQGFHCSKVFNFPSKPEHEPFQGSGPEIRNEINEGTVLLNYYGHGGGFQWDLVFLEDDIYQLENNGRLPVILSVTCYTAHFDNQKVFGEIFNEVEGKGSIGFYGSSGLTYWGVGKAINNQLFSQIFNQRNYIIGKAILNSKNSVPAGGIYGTQMALLTYLGDPALKIALPEYPDFAINSSDIKLTPENPLLGDTISVKINIRNWGTVFPNDSVVVDLSAGSADTSYVVGSTKLGSFGEKDSVYFNWVPNKGGLYNLIAKVNDTEIIQEEDRTDNFASNFFIIFNISEPYALEPIDGYSTQSNQVKFKFADIGHYINKELNTFIEIDTSSNFASPLINSGEIIPYEGQLNWTSTAFPQGVYYWRARIFDGTQFGNWSPTRSFTIMNQPKDGYFAQESILNSFNTYNIIYSDSSKSLILNTDPLPARPSNNTLLAHFYPDPQLPDSLKLTALTTDGTYLYFGNIWATAGLNQKTRLYKVGTGNNGTVEGQVYGQFSDFLGSIRNTITYHSDGHIYIAVGLSNKLVRINVSTEQIDTVNVPSGLLRWDTSRSENGYFYINSDGNYIYNLTTIDSLGNYKYTL
ncbi:MAG: hypothetical protein HKP17_01105 [Ignavibacteriaceae bacterium]|nr:hypothetical protein [Ignavibacteriaceae bacterium]